MTGEELQESTVTVIIVTWNSADSLLACLDSVGAQLPRQRLKMALIDNASSDDSVALAMSAPHQIGIVRNSENVGFARAVNQKLVSLSTDYALLLNPDTVLRQGSLAALLDYADADPSIGALGPRLVDPSARFRVKNGGWALTLRSAVCHFLGLSSLFPGSRVMTGFQRLAEAAGPEEQDWLSGACLLLRRDALRDSGLLDERWFLYVEDLDLCERIKGSGWRVVYHPGIDVVHLVGGGRRLARRSAPAAVRPGSWVGALRTYFVWRTGPTRLQLALFDGTVAVGLVARGLACLFRSMRGSRSAWSAEAETFFGYAGELLRLRRAGAPEPVSLVPRIPRLTQCENVTRLQ
jgi:N-acetylglucosaminyl-diphospho-decaprenol L-rhamnosyltransferase